jgi:uncharacterized membrane protein
MELCDTNDGDINGYEWEMIGFNRVTTYCTLQWTDMACWKIHHLVYIMVFPIKPPCIGDLQLPCLIMKGSYNHDIYQQLLRSRLVPYAALMLVMAKTKQLFAACWNRYLLYNIPDLTISGYYQLQYYPNKLIEQKVHQILHRTHHHANPTSDQQVSDKKMQKVYVTCAAFFHSLFHKTIPIPGSSSSTFFCS